MSDGTAAAWPVAALERRRRLALWGVLAALAVGILSWPVGLAIGGDGGSETREAIGGALFYAAIAGLIAAPAIVRAWQRFMERRALDEAVRGRPEIRHADGERQAAVRDALAEAFDLAAFRASGLTEPFQSARVDHVLAGRSRGVPFALTELRLLDAKRYRVFRGVLAGFRLARPRPGLIVVARDRGLLGNLLASAGSGVERVALEDPSFEGVFEAYGTDQVRARVVLTTTMLERLRELDQLAHARGFTCAFRDGHLLLAFRGMSWRPQAWYLLRPVQTWLPGYRRWIEELIELPARIAATLDLQAAAAGAGATAPTPRAAQPAPAGGAAAAVTLAAGHDEVFSGNLSRLIGEVGMPLLMIASGTIFGGLAAYFGWIGWREGFGAFGGWYIATLITLGLAYGVYAILGGLWSLARLARTWGAPLRGIPADRATGRPPPGRIPGGLS